MRLLPADNHLGWTPFVWLVYLAIFLAEPLLRPAPAGERSMVLAVTAVFLVLYFRGFWVRGARLVAIAAAIALIGVAMMPRYPGASVFFVYAAAFCGSVTPPRRAWTLLAGVLAVLGLTTWLGDAHPAGWVPGLVFSLMIGALTVRQTSASRRNARLRMEQEEVEGMARSAERERIARDLHDLLGQTLSLITLKSELARKLLPDDPRRAAQEMREVEAASRLALREVRRAVSGYRSLALAPELARARLALTTAGVETAVESGPCDLGPDAEGVAALALREAVTNVVRHARAGRCHIAYRQAGRRFRLTVEDDGRGCGDGSVTGATTVGAGSGLLGMRERLAAVGGELRLIDLRRSGEGRGTRLEIDLPAGGAAPPTPVDREVPAAGVVS